MKRASVGVTCGRFLRYKCLGLLLVLGFVAITVQSLDAQDLPQEDDVNEAGAEDDAGVHVISVEWVGVNPGDGQTNLSNDNPASHGGGWRLFPGKNSPAGQAHDKVKVKATLSETLEVGETRKVYFKVFDMDDPTQNGADNVADTNDTAGHYYGGDNRNAPGISPSATTEVTAAAGTNFAELEYTITAKNPGNNFRVVASCWPSYLQSVWIDSSPIGKGLDFDIYWLGEIVPSDYKSPLLSVWRKLYYEIDSMERPEYDENVLYGYFDNLELVNGRLYTVDSTIGYTDRATQGSYNPTDDEFYRGCMKLRVTGDDVYAERVQEFTDNAFPFDDVIEFLVEEGSDFGEDIEGWFDICDDDITLSIFKAQVYGGSVVDTPSMAAFSQQYQRAYITLVNDGDWNQNNVTFKKNMNTTWDLPAGNGDYSKMGEQKSIEGSADYRTVTILYAFQPSQGQDDDPISESATFGYAPLLNGTTYDKRCAVFREVITDAYNSDVTDELIAHEVAHALGLWHDDSSASNLMHPAPSDEATFSDNSLDELRDEM